MEDKKQECLDEAIKNIEKQFGLGSIMKLGSQIKQKTSFFSSGSFLIDKALGIGGYPKGRVIEIFGPESSGKTTLALHAIAEIQKQGGQAAFVDAEHAIDPSYAKRIGVDIDKLILSQPDSGEQALEIVELLIKSNSIDLIVVDSVAALVPQVELDGEMSSLQVGAQARLMSKALRKITALLNKAECSVIFINQLREKVGVVYGNPEVTPGGRALKFYASIRLDVRKGESLKKGNEIIGNIMKIKIVKNKVSTPFKTAEVELIYGEGINKISEVIDIASEDKIINKKGSWYEYEGEKLGQGKENVKIYFDKNPLLYEKILERLNQSIN